MHHQRLSAILTLLAAFDASFIALLFILFADDQTTFNAIDLIRTYTIEQSLVDLPLAALCRFVSITLSCRAAQTNAYIMSTTGVSTIFLFIKCIVYHRRHQRSALALLVLSSFAISWLECVLALLLLNRKQVDTRNVSTSVVTTQVDDDSASYTTAPEVDSQSTCSTTISVKNDVMPERSTSMQLDAVSLSSTSTSTRQFSDGLVI